MADQKKRSDLIRSQIENLLRSAPQPYTSAEQERIMKGRKGQKDIDVGRAAIEARNEEIRKFNVQMQTLNEQLGAAETEERTASAQTSEQSRRSSRYNQANSSLGLAAQTGATVAAPLVGVGAGRWAGSGINYLMDKSQESKNRVLAAAAQDRVSGLTTREGARTGVKLSGALPSENALMRVGGRMLPHFLLGGAMAGKGGLMLSQADEEGPFYPEMANRAAGLGMIGAGTGLVERGITYGVSPGVAPDAKSIAVIESNQLRRNNVAGDAKPLTPKATLLAEAKAAGVKGAGKMNMKQLTAALQTVKRLPKSAILAPLAAGALAYGLTESPAEAAGPDGGDRTAQATTNALGAAGAAYGATRGINALARYAPNAMRVAGRLAGPAGVGLAAYDVVQGIDRLAHLSPPQDPGEYSTMGAFMPDGGNAMAQAGAQPDPFGAALDEFLRLAPEMQMQAGP